MIFCKMSSCSCESFPLNRACCFLSLLLFFSVKKSIVENEGQVIMSLLLETIFNSASPHCSY